MDHKEAVQLQAAVKYVLGELPQEERDGFEEHYFDCGECALDVKAAAAFLDAGREVLRMERFEGPTVRSVESGRVWLAWFRPIVAVPALAALLIVVAYQNMVTIPRATQAAMRGAGQVFTSVFSLQMANTRGGEEVKVRVHPNESFALRFDFTPAKVFENYICQLQDETGRSILKANVPGSSVNQEAQFVVPAGSVKPGRYSLVFTGASGSGERGTGEEVLRLRFAVEF